MTLAHLDLIVVMSPWLLSLWWGIQVCCNHPPASETPCRWGGGGWNGGGREGRKEGDKG